MSKHKPKPAPGYKTRLPASAAHIWARCGGSRRIKNEVSPFDDKSQAQIGIVTHKVAANALRLEHNAGAPESLTTAEHQIYEANKADIDAQVAFYTDIIRNDWQAFKAESDTASGKRGAPEIHVEMRLTIETDKYIFDGPPDVFFVCGRTHRVTVYDLKSGFVEVEAENNDQLLLYAHSIAFLHNVKKPQLTGVIIQPGLYQVARADYTFDPDFFNRLEIPLDRFTVGAHCINCPVKTVCAEFTTKMKRFLQPEFTDYTLSRETHWPELLAIAGPAIKFFEEIRSQGFRYLQAGGFIEGWGLGQRSANRAWAEGVTPETIAAALSVPVDKLYSTRIETPAAVERMIKGDKTKEEKLSALCYKPIVQVLKKTVHDEGVLTKKDKAGKAVRTNKPASRDVLKQTKEVTNNVKPKGKKNSVSA